MRALSIAVAVVLGASGVVRAQTIHFNVDAQQGNSAISPYIYGVNNSLSGSFSNLTLERTGGNRLTAYNWENNASNAGLDWHFQNDSLMSSSNTPGAAMKSVLDNAAAHNAATIITIPTVGYVAADKLGNGDVRYPNGDTSKPQDPNYLATRFKVSLPAKGSAFTLTPSTSDGYVYQDEFVNWIKTNYPASLADPKKAILFSLDNEPDLWNSTHAEVHPAAATYAEMVQKTKDYGKAIKAVIPNAKVLGPVNYGWYGMTTLQNAPDGAGRDFLNYYLAQMKAAQDADPNHQRLLDVLDVHWYPEAQGGGVRITNQDATAPVVAARLQAPRSLWDPTYTETSWITGSGSGPINLIPRLQGKINANYSGTKLSITEYNYGAGSHISGGIAQADVLGIFGKQGVYAASEWPLATDEPFIAGAFNMYRNFDGANGTFGDITVQATTDDITKTSVYASTDSTDPNRMVLVVINKNGSSLTAALNVAFGGRAFRDAKIYQLTSGGSSPAYFGTQTINGNLFNYTMPAYSVSTLVLTAVPEPGVLSILAVGGLLALKRGRKQ